MVTKLKTIETETKKSRVKVGKLQLNKETVRDLTMSESKAVRGGEAVALMNKCGNGSGRAAGGAGATNQCSA